MHASARFNIVFIVLDTHRVDRLGCYGYQRPVSPNIDDFARASTLFENAIAPAQWTIPSHASMFSGEPPSTHMTTQSDDVLDADYETLSERLSAIGYHTVGFCNNPLVGVVNNELKRGFEQFYNYCGAVPSRPMFDRMPAQLHRMWDGYQQIVRKIMDPIQNNFATSDRALLAALNPLWVPLWTRVARFKGDTRRSVRDVTHFVRRHMRGSNGDDGNPHFLFFNLMEPHLPYAPPRRFIDQFVPYYDDEPKARGFIRAFNTQARRWLIPLEAPFSELEARTLSDMYDAEVAYQDHLLAELFDELDRPEHRDSTAVIVVADHGEMLGEHQFMGHGFGVYQELIHVPMLLRFPGQMAGQRVSQPVSTTRLFDTVLDLAGQETYETSCGQAVETGAQSLTREVDGLDLDGSLVISEAYAPEFAVNIMERHQPSVIDRLHCRATHWAVYEGLLKLIRIDGIRDRLFLLQSDPAETYDLLPRVGQARRIQNLASRLMTFVEGARERRSARGRRRAFGFDDELVRRRLRGLGYID
ncbi:MAG: sulfatase-like hydrolase/transferase [Anaerolineae bacterium]|nr:sulfatase-like hydrolase/transferase [Anaerolineae bacterium]